MRHVILCVFLGCCTQLQAQEKKHNFRIGNPEIVKRLADEKSLEEKKQQALVYKNFKFSTSEQSLIDKCNTSDLKYHTFEESQFVLMTNLVRQDYEFFKKYVALQYDSSLLTMFSKVTVNNKPSRNILNTSEGLYKSAKVHAITSGKNGTIGHQNFDKRLKKYNGKKFVGGENCAYDDKNSAIMQLILLLNSSHHYYNMLIPQYTHIGVSMQPHVKYSYNLVSVFGYPKYKMKTLVIHPFDPSTDFLKTIYRNKGWTVINNAYEHNNVIEEQMLEHDRIVMLGHGTEQGLLGMDRFLVTSKHVYILRDKINVAIWCNADVFVRRYALKGFFTGMIVSEHTEALDNDVPLFGDCIYDSNALFAKSIQLGIDAEDMLSVVKDNYKLNGNEVVSFNSKNLYEYK